MIICNIFGNSNSELDRFLLNYIISCVFSFNSIYLQNIKNINHIVIYYEKTMLLYSFIFYFVLVF